MIHLINTTKNASGQAIIITADGNEEQFETVSCVHCQVTWRFDSKSLKGKGWCYKCNGYICGKNCQECIPYMKKFGWDKGIIIS